MNPTAPSAVPGVVRVPDPVAPPADAPAREPATSPEAQPGSPAPAEASLWEMLTAEERAVYRRHAALGPLTYGADGRPNELPVVPTGGRIDVRG